MSKIILYFILIADNVRMVVQSISIASGIITALSLLIMIPSDDFENPKAFREKCFRILKISIPACVLGFTLFAIIPSSKNLMILTVAPKIYEAMTSDRMIQLGDKTINIADDFLSYVSERAKEKIDSSLKPVVKEETDGK